MLMIASYTDDDDRHHDDGGDHEGDGGVVMVAMMYKSCGSPVIASAAQKAWESSLKEIGADHHITIIILISIMIMEWVRRRKMM